MEAAVDPVEGWYRPLGEFLSQGDVVDLAPTGFIDTPLTICQPPNTALSGKANYYPHDQVPKKRSVEFIHAKGEVGRAMVIWPNCQIDKLKNQGRPESDWFVAVAAVHPMKGRLAPEVHDKVRSLRRAQFFPLPAKNPEIREDSYVDLRYIWSVRYSLLAKRVIAVSEEAQNALSFQLFWFMTEVRVREEIPCPHCGKQVDAAGLFAFKDEGEE